ncbi:MAG: biotin/lipoyl-binding protein, partial [Methylocella sp.]
MKTVREETSTTSSVSGGESPGEGVLTVIAQRALPVEVPGPSRLTHRRRHILLLLVVLIGGAAGAAGGWYWWRRHQNLLPAGIVWSNGRTDAEEIDIDTKFPGRVLKLLVEEGDMVKAGQIIAIMDTRDLEAELK